MRFTRLLVLFLASAAAFAGCSILSKQDVAELQAHQVDDSVLERMKKRDNLTVADVEELTRRGVPADRILHYIQRTGIRFVLTDVQTGEMRRAGVKAEVLNLMAKESEKYQEDQAATHGGTAPGFIEPPVAVIPRDNDFIPNR